MSSKKRVVITGMGVVSCLGQTVEDLHRNLLAGKSGICTVPSFVAADFPTKIGGLIQNFDVQETMDRKQARRADRYITYAVYAGKRALGQAGLHGEALERLDKRRCGVIIGSGMGGMDTFATGVRALDNTGVRRLSPFFVPYMITNMGGALLAMDTGFMGPNYSISTACATGSYSIAAATNHIRNGDADLMVCGGAEYAMTEVGLAGFVTIRALSERNDDPTKAARPWDKSRDGFVMGEGAGVLVLESYEHAIQRGATILGEVAGVGLSCDAYHITNPREDGRGIVQCIENSLNDAGMKPSDVQYINAHATCTPAGDMVEIRAIQQILPDTSRVTIHATKSLIGHCLGAASGIEAVVAVEALRTGQVHPTLNLDDPEPEILKFDVPTTAVDRDLRYGMSLSFGFGGHNASIIFRRYEGG